MLIYKILTANQWADLQAAGQTPGAPIDVADGFVHFSTAEQVAENVRVRVMGLTVPGSDDVPVTVTLSCGVAALAPGEDADVEALIRRADQALFAAKDAGRNYVQSARD